MKLYKTTIVILSDYDPTFKVGLEDLARDAMSGESYCVDQETEEVDSKDFGEGVQEFFCCGGCWNEEQI